MAARKRPSLKGRGAEIFLTDPDADSERPNAGRPGRQKARMPAYGYSGRKEKATFYLPEELLFALEEIWRDLRILTRAKVTKSEIVQAALERVAGEFKENGPTSRLLEDLGLPAPDVR